MRAKEIRELVKIAEESNIGELEVTYWWGRKIRISKTASSVAVARSGAVDLVTVSAQAVPVGGGSSTEAETAAALVIADKLVPVKAPMVGTFYRASSPDADPYVREGDVISQGQVLCIIEAMKLMNEIEAEVSGKIVKIMVENARPVEYNQVLFMVDPS
jgi:acetyl-CoA carboxylase biotin carboxyl carrier protein